VQVRPDQWDDTAMIQLTEYPLGVVVFGCRGIGIKPDIVMRAPHVNAAEYQVAVLSSQLEWQVKAQYDVKTSSSCRAALRCTRRGRRTRHSTHI
jgi:hypothetical protein